MSYHQRPTGSRRRPSAPVKGKHRGLTLHTQAGGGGLSLSARAGPSPCQPAPDRSHPEQATQLVRVRHCGPRTLEGGDDGRPLAILQSKPSSVVQGLGELRCGDNGYWGRDGVAGAGAGVRQEPLRGVTRTSVDEQVRPCVCVCVWYESASVGM